MHHKRANGERVGTVPFGFRTAADGVHLEEDPAEQDVLARIHQLKASRGEDTKRNLKHANGGALGYWPCYTVVPVEVSSK